jgi:uncharacterized protein (TIGR01244 family)
MLTTLVLLFVLQTSAQGPVKQTLPGATNVTRVDATVACGGATTAEAYPELKKLGFKSVINLRRESEAGADIPSGRAAAATAGLNFIHIPVDGANPSGEAAETFLKAVTDRANQPVYIHCGSANRVGAMWLIKRVVVDGWEIDRASAEAEAIGLTNPGLKQFAIEYATKNKGRPRGE